MIRQEINVSLYVCLHIRPGTGKKLVLYDKLNKIKVIKHKAKPT